MQIFKDKNGQGLIMEYTLTFFLVISFAIGMTAYVRRTVQARIHETARYTVLSVNTVFNDPSLNFVGNYYGTYEPYYQKSAAVRERDSEIMDGVVAGGQAGLIEKDIIRENAKSTTESFQAPPVCAD